MNLSLHQFFTDTFSRFSKRPLFVSVDGSYTWSYSDVYAGVRGVIAKMDDDFPVGEEARILLCLPNTPAFFISFAGSILAGLTPVIVNPEVAPEQLSQIAQRVDAKGIFCESTRTDLPKFFAPNVVYTDRDIDVPPQSSLPSTTPPERATSVAYIIFSSGSTGTPKGVLISPVNMLFELEAMRKAYRLGDVEHHLCVLPMYHASSLFRSILMPFSDGAAIYMAPEFEAASFWKWIETFDIGFVQVVPTILHTLLSHSRKPDAGSIQRLRFIGSASAPHTRELVAKFEKRFGVTVAQGYGLTETTCGAFLNHPDERSDRYVGAVGRPIDGIQVRIVGADGQDAPPGTVGEVVLAGPQIAIGYLDAIRHETKKLENGSLFTEDLGYLDEDGYLFLKGRKSDQVHRAGFKVSPVEVENSLMSHPDIADAVCFGIPQELLGEDLIAYVHYTGKPAFNERDIREFLAEKLPRYKVPSRVYNRPDAFQGAKLKFSRDQCRTKYLDEHPTRSAAPADPSWGVALHERTNPRVFKQNDVVYLRPLMEADIASDIYLDNIMDPEVQYFTYSGRYPQSEMEIKRYWASVKLPEAMVFAICDSETDEYVGNLALRIDWVPRLGEFGRVIFRAYQDRPYSFESMKLLMSYAFDELRLEKLWGGGVNPQSLPTLFKLGFSLEGRLRRHHFIKGEHRDQFMVGLLRSEYESMRRGDKVTPERIYQHLSTDILEPLCDVLSDAFGVPADSIQPSMSPADIDGWTSLGVVVLWSMLEEKFNISLSSSDLIAVTDVGSIAVMLEEKLRNP